MIANARMYSVNSETAELWRQLLRAVAKRAGTSLLPYEHPEPRPMTELWRRTDLGAVFMCGLPYSRAQPPPVLVAAPVPSPAEFEDRPAYWSEFVVRTDSAYRSVEDAFGTRMALTVPDSQSGCVAALNHLLRPGGTPPFSEIIAPTITPLGALSAVIDGAADIAPIDSYALALLRRHRSELCSRIRTVGRTVPTPIPPLVASAHAGVDALRAALLDAHRHAATRRLMEPLLLRRFAHPEPAEYAVLSERFEAVARLGGAAHLAARVHPSYLPA